MAAQWTKAKGGQWACLEYAAWVYRTMLGNSRVEDHFSLLVTIRMLDLHGLIEVQEGFWCAPDGDDKFVYEVGRSTGVIDVQVVDSLKLKRNENVDWSRVPEGLLDEWPPTEMTG